MDSVFAMFIVTLYVETNQGGKKSHKSRYFRKIAFFSSLKIISLGIQK